MFSVKKVSKLLKVTIICSIVFDFVGVVSAKEGMWIPATILKRQADMQNTGLSIPVSRIYNDSGTGLNNAIVLFGKGCTGEIISPDGLLLTNHHCGYGTVQGLTSKEKDYFATGFFAKSRAEELPCPGLTVTFIRKMENITDKLVVGLQDTLNDKSRDSILKQRIAGLERKYEIETGLDATIKSFYEGNQYWIFITQTYKDIRLVSFPPNGIGAFGGDDENWAWPRHTGDFSMFRVYAGASNKPADYSTNNTPYHADPYLKINIKPKKEDDFTMVYGFPGTTYEYVSSYELNQVMNIVDPIAVDTRTARLGAWTKHMDASRDIFLKYTSKRAGVANGWKKWGGELVGLRLNHAMDRKEEKEVNFRNWVKNANIPMYSQLLDNMQKLIKAADTTVFMDVNVRERLLAIELIAIGANGDKMVQCLNSSLGATEKSDSMKKLTTEVEGFYKNYDMATDKDVFVALMPLFMKDCSAKAPAYLRTQLELFKGDFQKWADNLYGVSVFTSKPRLDSALAKGNVKLIEEDPAYKLYAEINKWKKQSITPFLDDYKVKKKYLNRLYQKALLQMDTAGNMYPDANSTLRVAYGNIAGLKPDAGGRYRYITYLKSVIKADDTTKETFKVPAKLKELYANKDFGRWAYKRKVPVAFVASNHTSGGNSGSPVLNDKGELMGLNFDRPYEGTMSDYLFDPSRCRNISVDLRYVLFVLDKFGGAGWLINEMTIVE